MRAALLLALLALTGCASINNAGTASYTVRPFVIGDKAVCCDVKIYNGKEIALLDATIIKSGDNYQVHLHQEGVAAFEGQRIASHAIDTAAASAVKAAAIGGLLVAAPVVAPALGAALSAPGLGAAAMGAGALAVGQQLAQ